MYCSSYKDWPVGASEHVCACRLWNLTSDNLSAIQKPFRKPVPSLREFLDPVIQEMDPEQGIEDQYKVGFQPSLK